MITRCSSRCFRGEEEVPPATTKKQDGKKRINTKYDRTMPGKPKSCTSSKKEEQSRKYDIYLKARSRHEDQAEQQEDKRGI